MPRSTTTTERFCTLIGAVLLVAAMAVMLSRPGAAHPHAWIDLRSAIQFDDEARIVALRIEWIFDDMLSAYSVAGMTRIDGRPAPEALESLGRRNLDNLRDYDFFTDIRIDGQRLKLLEVVDEGTTFSADRLRMRFTLPLPEPVNPRERRVVFSVYDPSFFIEITHMAEEPVGLLNGGETGCAGFIRPPAPNSTLRTLAEAYGKDDSIDAQLVDALSGQRGVSIGQILAETVTVTCP